ncbi:hypothetical protein Glove_120g239 [Diversispora epigaea]|uniref:Uncharacterized protein n=1 Tax=Diversispora epigaea TaxID=1348612 RepID=A0A397J8H0_9GLOM|nr:hypothetical protein Glove_120g239 [Diversispora epigaea]
MNTLTPEYLEWKAKLTELPSILTNKIRSRFCKRYKKKTGLNPWLNSKTFQIEENADDYMSHDCVIKISKFPEDKDIIHDAIHTHLDIWDDWSCLETSLHQYAIEHEMDPKKFSVITEVEKKRWTMRYFRGDLERDIYCYQGGIKKKENPRKYHKFLTDRERLVGKELLRHDILKSGLSTT